MVFLIPLEILIPITLVVIILIVVTWIVYNKNKKIAGKLISEKIRFHRYKKGTKTLKENPKNPEKDFDTLQKYIRAFFKEYLDLDYSLTYLELESKFKKQKKPEYAKLCKSISDVNYKGEQKSAEDIMELVNIFSNIIKSY